MWKLVVADVNKQGGGFIKEKKNRLKSGLTTWLIYVSIRPSSACFTYSYITVHNTGTVCVFHHLALDDENL